MDAPVELPGIKKAAILLLTMDENLSKEVIKELDEDEIEAVGQEIARLRLIPHDVVSKVQEEFAKKIDGRKKNVVGGESKFKMLIEKSLGSEKAELFMGNMESRRGMPGDFLRTADARILANVIRGEHPQTIALVLSILERKKGARPCHVPSGEDPSRRALPDGVPGKGGQEDHRGRGECPQGAIGGDRRRGGQDK